MIINKKYYTADNAILRVGIDKWLKYEDNLITVKKKLFIKNSR